MAMPGNVVNKQKVNPIRGCKCCEGLRKWRARVHSNAHSIETLDCPDICPAVNQYRKYRGLIGASIIETREEMEVGKVLL
jgi:hypothetical protein